MFFDTFYEQFAREQSVGSAMHDARRIAIERGLPLSSWASFVVIGDDSVMLASPAPSASLLSPLILAAAAAILLWMIVVDLRRRARRNV